MCKKRIIERTEGVFSIKQNVNGYTEIEKDLRWRFVFDEKGHFISAEDALRGKSFGLVEEN